jgi:hypothetical protein
MRVGYPDDPYGKWYCQWTPRAHRNVPLGPRVRPDASLPRPLSSADSLWRLGLGGPQGRGLLAGVISMEGEIGGTATVAARTEAIDFDSRRYDRPTKVPVWRIHRVLWISIVAAVLALMVPVTTEADAAPVRECGSAGTIYDGAVKLTNVTSRNVRCSRARRLFRQFELHSGEESGFTCSEDFYCEWRGWHCRNDGRSRRYVDHRCEKPAPDRTYVVRWQAR